MTELKILQHKQTEISNEKVEISRETYDHYNAEDLKFKALPGISEELVKQISKDKGEPEWMLQKRLTGLRVFNEKPMPNWGPNLDDLNLDEIIYYMRPNAKKNSRSWADVPEDIRKTYEKLGIPKAEQESLGGVGAQYESEIIYHNLKKSLEEKGVVFLDMDEAVKQYPELVKKYFMTTCIPINLHKFSALHAAVWSGGTFIYIPKKIKVDIPLQAYFRMNAKKGGQFEHTLIIVDEDAEVHYIEGCSAPQYTENSLHAGGVEIHCLKNSRVRYSSIENWSKNTYNLNTKRAIVHENAIMEWVNGNLGCLTGDSKVFTNNKGPVNIESIKKGDSVYVFNEELNKITKSKVKNKIFSGNKKVYKLRAGGREIEASANHPFLTLIREKNNPSHKKGFFHKLWKPLEELKEGDLVAITKKLSIEGKSHQLPKIRIGKKVKTNILHLK